MEGPKRIHPQGLADYLETMSKSVFQTGISWHVVESKWPGTRAAFQGFDPEAVANFSPDQLDELTRDTRIVRNRRKIEAIVENARRMLELDREYGGFRKYLGSFSGYDELARDLKKQFKFIGEMGAYHFLYVVGEKVPPWEEWAESHGWAKAHAGAHL